MDVLNFVSKRYKLNKYLSQSKWGNIYYANDTKTKENILIEIPNYYIVKKEDDRNKIYELILDETNILENNANKNIVPRTLDFDDNGNEFFKYPSYGNEQNNYETKTLDSIINEKHYKNGLDIDLINEIIKGTFLGIAELNSSLSRPHSNIRPESFIVNYNENGNLNRIMLFDLDTKHHFYNSLKEENIGYIYTMPPEGFKNEKLTYLSNIWSLGSLYYRLFTGKYIFEDELNKKTNPEEWIKNLSIKEGNKLINKKLKKNSKYLPEHVKYFLRKSLDFNSKNRYYSFVEKYIPINNLYKIFKKNTNKNEINLFDSYNQIDTVIYMFNKEKIINKYLNLTGRIFFIGAGLLLSTYILFNRENVIKKLSNEMMKAEMGVKIVKFAGEIFYSTVFNSKIEKNENYLSYGLTKKEKQLEIQTQRARLFGELINSDLYYTKIDTTKDHYDANYSVRIPKYSAKVDSLRKEYKKIEEEYQKIK
jgi:hypothetical protein